MTIKSIIKKSIDLHVHVGPEIIPRKFTVQKLLELERGNIAGLGVKNHFFPTTPMNYIKEESDPILINSVVLNNYVGGLNHDIIRASAELNNYPILVWFPTLHVQNFANSSKFEIAEEWIDPILRKSIVLQEIKNINLISVLANFEHRILQPQAICILEMIKSTNAILCSGHLSWFETETVVEYAVQKLAISKIIITHPIYQKIRMPLEVQQKLANLGAYMEHCFSMYSIDKISIIDIVRQIKRIGYNSCIISSDVGQTFSPVPSEALLQFAELLIDHGVSLAGLEIMMVNNPNKLIL